METEIIASDIARSSALVDYDKARHPLTIADAVELFAQLGTPRSKRSVQRICEQGHLDCVRIKGPRGDQFLSTKNRSCATPKSCARSKPLQRSVTMHAMTHRNTLRRAPARQCATQQLRQLGTVKLAACRDGRGRVAGEDDDAIRRAAIRSCAAASWPATPLTLGAYPGFGADCAMLLRGRHGRAAVVQRLVNC